MFLSNSTLDVKIDQKGMTFDHDFGYSLSLFSSLLKKEGRRKGGWIAKIVIKSDAFPLNQTEKIHWIYFDIYIYTYIIQNIYIYNAGKYNRKIIWKIDLKAGPIHS